MQHSADDAKFLFALIDVGVADDAIAVGVHRVIAGVASSPASLAYAKNARLGGLADVAER
jgi:hypothetical protein